MIDKICRRAGVRIASAALAAILVAMYVSSIRNLVQNLLFGSRINESRKMSI